MENQALLRPVRKWEDPRPCEKTCFNPQRAFSGKASPSSLWRGSFPQNIPPEKTRILPSFAAGERPLAYCIFCLVSSADPTH
jgi:hypothetical protein